MKQRLAVTFEYTGYIEINIEDGCKNPVFEAMNKFNYLKKRDHLVPKDAKYVSGSIRLSTEDIDKMKNILQ